MVAIRDQEWIKLALFVFFQGCRTHSLPRPVPNPEILLQGLSPDPVAHFNVTLYFIKGKIHSDLLNFCETLNLLPYIAI